ncbi:MAG: helix-turn-helix domain-containing protein [Burkholderiaceae bacterium]|jgi:DNA-binding transcriptional regulator YhcF (GntR family)|nr:helix-turn-helix domain-containing protein [Burkholderiaceae bacterium]
MAFQIVAAAARKAHLFETPTQALIFQCLATYCDKTGCAWPSYETLARECNCSYRTVQRAFASFKRQRYVYVMRRWNTSSII